MPFEVPSSWVWTNIEELFFVTKLAGFEYTDCLTNDTISSNNEVPIVRAQNVRMGYFVENTNEAISEALSQQLERSALTKKCLLMTFIGAGIGDTCIFPALKRCHLAPNVAKIEPYSNKIDLKYALYYLMSDLGQLGVRGISKSTAQPSLSMATIRSLEIALPPLAEQHRIVAEIEKLFELIDQIEQGKADLQTIIKQTKSKILDLAIHGKLVPQDPNDEPAIELLKRINPDFTPCDNGHYPNIPFDIPRNWIWVELGKIGRWQSGSTPNRLNKAYYGGNIPWLKTGDLNDGYITHIPEYITEKALNETSVKLNPIGSVLIAMYGATIGKIGILTFAATTNQACCACDVFEGIEKEYLFYFLLSHKEEFIKLGGGGAQPNISKEKIVSTYIPLPPNAEQIRIIKTIHQLFDQLDIITESL